MRLLGTLLLLSLSACTEATIPVAPDAMASAHEYIEKDFEAPWPLEFGETWYSRNDPEFQLICGEFDAPKALDQQSLRYVYDPEGGWGLIEVHSLVVTSSPVTRRILTDTKLTFDQLWARSCEDHRPSSLFF
ncbi:MAG: hypothetical protein AAFY42_12350 [Pseudomonadota bacterium]